MSYPILGRAVLLFAALSAGQCLAQGCDPGSSFTLASRVAPGALGERLAFGDFNGDGHDDMLFLDSNTSLALMVNDGNLGFTLGPRTFLTISSFLNVGVGDLDGDGSLDAVIANRLFFNDGLGGFTQVFGPTNDFEPEFVVVLDADADGSPDIATFNRSARKAAILLNDGTGSFVVDQTYEATAAPPSGMAAGDFDADGDTDLCIISFGTPQARVLFNDGAGRFGTAATVDAPAFAQSVAIGDLDGDGLGDLVFGTGGRINVLFKKTEGLFQKPVEIAASGLAGRIALGDIDNDGDLDVVSDGDAPSDVVFMLNDGSGGFPSIVQRDVNGDLIAVGIHDLDADGDLDLVTTNPVPSECTTSFAVADVYENQCRNIPVFASGPSSTLVDPGAVAQFSVSLALGNEPLSYQWKRDGVLLLDGDGVSGSLTPTLTLENVVPADAGLYSLTVFNDLGFAASDEAILGVRASGCPADLAAPFDVLNFFDVVTYINAFNAGCP